VVVSSILHRDQARVYVKHVRDGPATALRHAFQEANAGINTVGTSNPEFRGLGTRNLFSATSVDQLPLFGGGAQEETEVAEAPTQTITRRAPQRKPVRQVLPSHLPREVIVIEPQCDTSELKKIGEEVSESLDYRPAKLIVIRRVRPKYVDPSDEDRGVIIAALPPRPIDKGMAEPGLLANIVIDKYVDHLPLYRQVQRFTRQGITLPATSLERHKR
jgi:transposase